MKKKIVLSLIILVLLGAGFVAYHYISQAVLIKEANKTALKMDQITEEINIEDLSTYFNGNKGSFVLFDKDQNSYTVFNEEQSQYRDSPCSTFKILNSLIGLETKVLEDENTLIKWNGKHNYIDSWNKDHTLATAFSNSVVWYYQEVAAKVGKEKMQSFLKEAAYGNSDLSGGLTKFWLVSSLRISPLEQVVFLRKFYSYDLPFSANNIDIVKKIMVISKEDNGITLSGKTGSAGDNLSWFVGYVEKDKNVYFFATKIEGKIAASSPARRITEAILRDKKLL